MSTINSHEAVSSDGSGSKGPARVLLEMPAAWRSQALTAQFPPEWSVDICNGPARSGPCPLLESKPCPAIHAADVVVAGLGVESDSGRDIVCGIRECHPHTPLVVLVSPGDAARYQACLEGCTTVLFPWTAAKLCDAVRTALATRPATAKAPAS